MWPWVGPAAESIRSNCTLVSTLGAKPKPNSPRRVASKASKPGVSTTLPTSSSIVSSGLVVVDGPGLADLASTARTAPDRKWMQLSRSMTGTRGEACGMGQVDARPGGQVLVEAREVRL